MNDSELPEAAIHAGIEAELDLAVEQGWMLAKFRDVQRKNAVLISRAVLVAATERIECPLCTGQGFTGSQLVGTLEGGLVQSLVGCSVCAGSGVLFVLKNGDVE